MQIVPLSALASVAVCNAVETLCRVRPKIKWPNDLVIGRRKVCGILSELVADPDGNLAVILGIGINVSQTPKDFSPDVAMIASSLLNSTGQPVSRIALAGALIWELERLYAYLKAGVLSGYLEDYKKSCINLGETVQVIAADGSREIATATDIDESFSLVIQDADGQERHIRSGEVSVRGLYGYVD